MDEYYNAHDQISLDPVYYGQTGWNGTIPWTLGMLCMGEPSVGSEMHRFVAHVRLGKERKQNRIGRATQVS